MPQKRTVAKRSRIVIQVSVKSTDPSVDTTVLLRDMEKARPQLKKSLSVKRKISGLSFRRRGTYPIGVESALISIVITLASEAGKEAAKKLAADVYEWLKTKWKDAHFGKVKPTIESKGLSVPRKRGS